MSEEIEFEDLFEDSPEDFEQIEQSDEEEEESFEEIFERKQEDTILELIEKVDGILEKAKNTDFLNVLKKNIESGEFKVYQKDVKILVKIQNKLVEETEVFKNKFPHNDISRYKNLFQKFEIINLTLNRFIFLWRLEYDENNFFDNEEDEIIPQEDIKSLVEINPKRTILLCFMIWFIFHWFNITNDIKSIEQEFYETEEEQEEALKEIQDKEVKKKIKFLKYIYSELCSEDGYILNLLKEQGHYVIEFLVKQNLSRHLPKIQKHIDTIVVLCQEFNSLLSKIQNKITSGQNSDEIIEGNLDPMFNFTMNVFELVYINGINDLLIIRNLIHNSENFTQLVDEIKEQISFYGQDKIFNEEDYKILFERSERYYYQGEKYEISELPKYSNEIEITEKYVPEEL